MMRPSHRLRTRTPPPRVDALGILCSRSLDAISASDRDAILEQVIRPTWKRMVELPARPSPAILERSLSTIADAIGRRCVPTSRIRATTTAKTLATIAYQKGQL